MRPSYPDTIFHELVDEGALRPGDGLVGVCYVTVYSFTDVMGNDNPEGTAHKLSCWVEDGDCYFEVERPEQDVGEGYNAAYERALREFAVAGRDLQSHAAGHLKLVEIDPGWELFETDTETNFHFASGRIDPGKDLPSHGS